MSADTSTDGFEDGFGPAQRPPEERLWPLPRRCAEASHARAARWMRLAACSFVSYGDAVRSGRESHGSNGTSLPARLHGRAKRAPGTLLHRLAAKEKVLLEMARKSQVERTRKSNRAGCGGGDERER